MHGIDDGQHISVLDSFICALPSSFLFHFKEWLVTGTNKALAADVKFDNITYFLVGEIIMHLDKITYSELDKCNLEENVVTSNNKVQKVMTKPDRPVSKRLRTDGTCGYPADSFEPIMRKVLDNMNTNCRGIYMMIGVTCADKDEVKLPHCSPRWSKYGFKRTPTKDKKLKPVVHLTASVGSDHILPLCVYKIGLKLAEMLAETVKQLISSPEHRPLTTMFLDRGYLDLAKE